MKRTWTIIGVGDVPGSFKWYQALFGQPATLPAHDFFGQKGLVGVFTSASPRCIDGGDVDLLHRHHRLEGTFCLTAASRKRIG